MIHSPSERNGRCYADPKPGGAGSQSFGPSWTAFPGHRRELEGKRGCWDRTGAHMGSRGVQGEDLNHCATAPGPRDWLFGANGKQILFEGFYSNTSNYFGVVFQEQDNCPNKVKYMTKKISDQKKW